MHGVAEEHGGSEVSDGEHVVHGEHVVSFARAETRVVCGGVELGRAVGVG